MPQLGVQSVSLVWTWLYWGWIALEILVSVWKRAPADADRHDRGSQILLWVVLFPAVTICEFIRHLWPPNIPGGALPLNAISLAVMIAGLAIRMAAILSLGRSFTANVAIQETQTVKRTGLYRVVRHPSYLGLLMVLLAIGLHSKNWVGLAVALIPTTAVMLYRIHVEEEALVKAFGAEYRDYARETKRLVPGVY